MKTSYLIGPQWAEDDSIDDESIAFLSSKEVEVIEQHFDLTAFLHGEDKSNFGTKKTRGKFFGTKKNNITFEGLRIATCANRISANNDAQYQAYGIKLNLQYSVESANNPMIKGISGTSKAVGLVVIQLVCKELDVVIDFVFIIIENNGPILFSVNDMLDNGLGISMQR